MDKKSIVMTPLVIYLRVLAGHILLNHHVLTLLLYINFSYKKKAACNPIRIGGREMNRFDPQQIKAVATWRPLEINV